MLKLIDVSPSEKEILKITPYTVEVDWGKRVAGVSHFWRANYGLKSLCEIGIYTYLGTVNNFALIAAEHVFKIPDNEPNYKQSISNFQFGQPCFEINGEKSLPIFMKMKSNRLSALAITPFGFILAISADPKNVCLRVKSPSG